MDARRAIPSIERLLSSPELQPLLEQESHARVVGLLRIIQEEVRSTGIGEADVQWYAKKLDEQLKRERRRSLRGVINATGVVLHTNLGRAPLSAAAIAAINAVARDYSNLEYDLDEGQRGSRYTHCAQLLASLTGAQDALVVNNNAAALTLALNTIALARPAVVSRGELVEIGDSFRITEITRRSGVTLREVGATNRTHLKDYENALDGAAAILKVHPSNFATTGFVADVSAADLSVLARSAGIPLVHDLGSGLIDDLSDLGLKGEPTAAEAIGAGADVVTMSGDKLLGGPQAGIVLGTSELISAMKRNPLCRALRVDKLTLAALEATLLSYARGTARSEIPVLRMLALTSADLNERAAGFAARLPDAQTMVGTSIVGGGAFPAARLETTLIVLGDAALEAKLRLGDPPVIARMIDGRVAIDLRTVLPQQEETLIARLLNG